MTQRIDLMPESCRQRLGRRSLVRRWAMLYASTALIFAIGFGAFELAKANVRDEASVIREKVSLDADQKVKADRLNAEIEAISASLARHERLSWPINVADIIAAIGSVTPESVFLTNLSISPRQERASRIARTTRDGSAPEQPRVRIQIECEGYAPDDHAMAEFVKGLERHPLFQQIALEFAQKATLGSVEARSFSVTCQVDMSVDYLPDGALADGGAP